MRKGKGGKVKKKAKDEEVNGQGGKECRGPTRGYTCIEWNIHRWYRHQTVAQMETTTLTLGVSLWNNGIIFRSWVSSFEFASVHWHCSFASIQGIRPVQYLHWLSPNVLFLLPSVLWHCWLGGRKGIRPVKNGGWWRWALVSRMVGVSASVNFPLHHKV